MDYSRIPRLYYLSVMVSSKCSDKLEGEKEKETLMISFLFIFCQLFHIRLPIFRLSES